LRLKCGFDLHVVGHFLFFFFQIIGQLQQVEGFADVGVQYD